MGRSHLHMRVKSGTRIEETAKLCDEVEQQIRKDCSGRANG